MADEEHVLLRCTLNGRPLERSVPVQRTLHELLHDDLGLVGTRLACGAGVCGTCLSLVDGEPRASCATFAFQVQGCQVTSVEGLASNGVLHPLQQAFIDHGAFQCGYRTSGMLLLAKALLDREPTPSRERITEWLSSNVCRCTGYAQIIDAVQSAAARMAGAQS